jgi:hypothetical protein
MLKEGVWTAICAKYLKKIVTDTGYSVSDLSRITALL